MLSWGLGDSARVFVRWVGLAPELQVEEHRLQVALELQKDTLKPPQETWMFSGCYGATTRDLANSSILFSVGNPIQVEWGDLSRRNPGWWDCCIYFGLR